MDDFTQNATRNTLSNNFLFGSHNKRKYKRINFSIKKDCLDKTLNDSLKLKEDIENVSSFKDNYNNQLFFVLTEEQFFKIKKSFEAKIENKEKDFLEELRNLRGFAMQLKMHDRYERLLCQISSIIKDREIDIMKGGKINNEKEEK